MSTTGFGQRLRGPACAVALASAFASPLAQGADTQQVWIEITSPHFVVVTNAGDRKARDVAQQFEQIRSVYQAALPKTRVDPGQPMIILAVKTQKDLRELLPQYWERKGQLRPAGTFQRGSDKHYVALRLDVRGPNPHHIVYHTVYHEYFHLLLELNTPGLPPWLSEGLAEFWGNATIEGRTVETGWPAWAQLDFLDREKLLPLDVLLSVDRSSPFYNEANKATIFYAQSWALTHYLMLGDGTGDAKRALATYVSLLQGGGDPDDAAQRAFGDLKVLQKKLDSYVGRRRLLRYRMEAPPRLDPKQFNVRQLSPAESLAVRGDFIAHGERPPDARPLLQQALNLDPDLAQAHESMGFLYYREGNRDEAARWFGKAAELDSRSFLAHYFHATLRLEKPTDAGELEAIAQSLRRVIELNPRFAPAYAQLAGVYAILLPNLEEALALAQKAVDLNPAEAWIYVSLGDIRMMMGETEEARKLGERALRLATSAEEESFAQGFLERVEEHNRLLPRQTAGEGLPGEPEAEAVEQSEPAATTNDHASQATPEAGRPPPWFGKPVQEVRGVLSGLQCLPGGALDFIVSVGDQKVVLHATSPKSLLILEDGKFVSKNFQCGPLYHQVIARFVSAGDAESGSDVKGTLISLEFLKEPK